MYRTRTRIVIAAVLLTVVAVGFVSAIGIVAQDATPIPPLATGSPAASPGNLRGPVVDLVDIAFDPRGFALSANTPTVVTLVNRGAAVHTFDIDELGVHSGAIQPGQSTTVTIAAAAGTYTYSCAIPGHRQAGMVGTLTVK
jgi:nitrite reductase (NO-forming)